MSLNASKTELLIFRHPNKKFNYDLKIKIEGKRLIPSNYEKNISRYPRGIEIDEQLNWNFHVDTLAPKLARAIGMLLKIRHESNSTLHTIYFGLFESILTYGAQIWSQIHNKSKNRIITQKNIALRIINFSHEQQLTNDLHKTSKILKFCDHINLQKFLYAHDFIKCNLPVAFNNNFKFTQNVHNYNTCGSSQHQISLLRVKIQIYGIKSINYHSISIWNKYVC